MPNTVLKCRKATRFNAQSLTNTCHLASPFNATVKQTLRGMKRGFTSSEELKIRTMESIIHPLMNLLFAVSKLLNLAVH